MSIVIWSAVAVVGLYLMLLLVIAHVCQDEPEDEYQ